jgi:DNA-binding response OmpR family regulator
VLVVEDDEDIARLVGTVLVEEGHQVSHVGTGGAALSAALIHEYDLLICDLMLPDLQGTEIVRALKAQSPRLPVMVISALDAHEWAKPCEDAGATRFLQKPLDIDALREEVTLVQKARLNLRIAIADADRIHSTRLSKVLSALGCEVAAFDTVAATQSGIAAGYAAGLLVIDADLGGAADLITWGKERGIPAFVVCNSVKEDTEDRLMRAGAAFIMTKPVNIDALLTQASFMVAL